MLKKILIILSPLIIIIAGIIFHFITYKPDDKYEARDYAQIEKDGYLSIVTNLDPTTYYISGDSISGFNYELLNALENLSPLQFNVKVENSLEESLEGLKSGKYDVIARNIPVNSELKQEYSFTNPIMRNKLVLVQRKPEYNNGKEPIRNHLDMGNITIHIAKNSPAILRLKNLSEEIGDSIYIVENEDYDSVDISLMVASGEIDYTVLDYRAAQEIASRIPELDILTDIGFTHLESWAVRPSSIQLLDSLNTWIERYKNTKDYTLLVRKYYDSKKKR